jgi:hypothetical protein
LNQDGKTAVSLKGKDSTVFFSSLAASVFQRRVWWIYTPNTAFFFLCQYLFVG